MQPYLYGIITCVIRITMVPPPLCQSRLAIFLHPDSTFLNTSLQKRKEFRLAPLEAGVEIKSWACDVSVGLVSVEKSGLLEAIPI